MNPYDHTDLPSRLFADDGCWGPPAQVTSAFVQEYRGKGAVAIADVPEDMLPSEIVRLVGRVGTYVEVVETVLGPAITAGDFKDRIVERTVSKGIATLAWVKPVVSEMNRQQARRLRRETRGSVYPG